MPREELRRFLPSKVSVENGQVDGREIDHHQSIERITKIRVDVESKQLRVQFQVLTQKNRHTFSVVFRRCDEPVRLLDRSGRRGRWSLHGLGWVDSFDQIREVGGPMILLEKP